MDYTTENMKINLEVLESILYNAEKDIPKLKISIFFDDQEKYTRFVNKVNPATDLDNEILSSDSEQQKQEQQKIESKEELLSKEDEEVVVDKLDDLEESIILKQFYRDEIKRIEEDTGTRVLIVPQKVKYFGNRREDIEEAQLQIYEIRKCIKIEKIKNWGREIYQSQYYSKKIEDANIHLIKIVAEKYIVWYDERKVANELQNQLLKDAFKLKSHYFYPLFYTSPEIYKRFNEKYITAIIKTKGFLFNNYLKESLNESYDPQFHIQLAKSQTDLIIHCNAKQQSDMRICDIKTQFGNFFFFFLSYYQDFNEEDEGQIRNIDKISKYLQEKEILFYKFEKILVIAYQKQYLKKMNESVLNKASVLQKVKQEFLENIKPIFQFNLNCQVEVLIDPQYGVDDFGDQGLQAQIPISKQITVQKKLADRIKVITPKNKKVSLFTQIIDLYLLTPLLNKNKKKQHDTILEQTMQISSIADGSRIMDETTMLGKQKDEESFFEPPQELVTEEMKMTKKSIYNFFIQDLMGLDKYSDSVDKIKKGTLDSQLSDFIRENKRIHFKVSNVKVPQKFIDFHHKLKKQSGDSEVVTLFYKQQQGQSLYTRVLDNEVIELLPFDKNHVKNKNGWLVNVPRKCLQQKNYLYYLTGGQNQDTPHEKSCEIIKYLKFIKIM